MKRPKYMDARTKLREAAAVQKMIPQPPAAVPGSSHFQAQRLVVCQASFLIERVISKPLAGRSEQRRRTFPAVAGALGEISRLRSK